MGAIALCSERHSETPQVFEYKIGNYISDLMSPNAPKPPPPPLETSDPELADLIQWFEHQPKAVRNKLEVIHVAKKVGRNDLCPCGSLKKFKKCCIDLA